MKKFLSFLLTAVMLLSIISTAFIGVSATETEIPEGYTPIYDIEDLYGVRNNLSGNYILMADIDMTEDTAEGGDWDTNGCGWAPIGTDADNAFSGVFDGNGHSIIGMRIETAYNGQKCVGLFGYFFGTVKNLKLVNSKITIASANERVGTLAGSTNNAAKITNVAVVNTTITNSLCNNESPMVGGLVGVTFNTTIEKSWVSGIVYGYGSGSYYKYVYCYTGGIVGRICQSTVIENCYNLATVSIGGTGPTAGIAGKSNRVQLSEEYPTIKNCINIGNAGYALLTTYDGGTYDKSYKAYNNYYLNGSVRQGVESVADSEATSTGVSAAQLKSEVALANLDFENTWFIDTATGIDHPQLQSNPEVDAEKITIKNMPKQQFLHHDEFDCSGLTVIVEYENGTTSERKIKPSAVSGYDMSVTGTQTVTVKYLGAETTYDIVVNERPVDNIELSDSDVVMDIDTTKDLAVTFTPINASNKTVTWTSDDESVATVDENGTVTAMGRGSAIITATTYNGISKSCYVEVLVPATAVSIDESVVTMQPDETHELKAILNPENSTDTLTWSSSDENVATVDENGIVTAVGTGTATITVKTSRNKFASCTVQVRIFSTAIDMKSEADVNVGEKLTLTATMTPANTTDTITWKSSDSSVASVSSTGVVTAKKVGTVTITATTTSGLTANCEVSVLKPSTSIKLDKTSITINKGSFEALVPTILPGDSTDGVTWTSSNESVATVENGIVTAVGRGMAVITAKTDSGYSATCVVNVVVPAESIMFDKNFVTVEEGSLTQLNAVVNPEDTTDTISWSSSDTDIVAVSDSGVVSALAYGEAVITATTSNGKTAECKVVVEHVTGEWTLINTETGDKLIKPCKVCGDVLEEKIISENSIAVLLKTTDGKIIDAIVVSEKDTVYFENIDDGDYVVVVSKTGYTSREYIVTATDNFVSCETEKLNRIGDINGDGKVNTVDVARANAQAKRVSTLSGYEFACADVNGDGKVNTLDVAKMNAHAKSVTTLW